MQKTVFIKLAVAIVSAGLLLGCDRPKSEETSTNPPIASSENQSSKDEVSPAWGPPITRTLEFDGPGKRCYVDLDTGKIFAKPKNLSGKDLQEWIDKTGVDLLCRSNQDAFRGPGTVLIPVMNLTCYPEPKLQENDKESLASYRTSDAKSLLEKDRRGNQPKNQVIRCIPLSVLKPGYFYVFQTRDGRIGLLEFQAATENAATFTYRLQQEKPASQPSAPPASQPAAKSAAAKVKAAFERIAQRVSALEKTYPVLEGISNIQPTFSKDPARAWSANWSFSKNIAWLTNEKPPRKTTTPIKSMHPPIANDPQKPFITLHFQMICMAGSMRPRIDIKHDYYFINGQKWAVLQTIQTDDPKLKKAVETIINEELNRIATLEK